MPDLVTHLAFSHILLRCFERGGKIALKLEWRIFFYLGVFLPDLLTRPFYILFPGPVHAYTQGLHTPIGSGIAVGIISLLIEEKWRKAAFLGFTSGMVTHFLLDAFQKQLIGNNFWLFPFSWRDCALYPVAWASDFIEWLPVTFGIVILFEALLYGMKKRAHATGTRQINRSTDSP